MRPDQPVPAPQRPRQQWSSRSYGGSEVSWGSWLAVGAAALVVLAVMAGMNHNSGSQFPPDAPFTVEPLAQDPFAAAFPAEDPLVPVGSLNLPRADHTATLLPDGRVVIAGGVFGDAPATGSTSSVEIYDPVSHIFQSAGSLQTPRSGHTATLLPDGRVLIAGGKDASGAALASAEIYDPATGVSRPTGSLITARMSATAIALDSGRVLIVGGSDGANMVSEAETYVPESDGFNPEGSTLGSGYVTGVKLRDRNVLVAGGNDSSGGPLATIDVWDPSYRAFLTNAQMDEPRQGATSCLLPNGSVLIVGGLNDSGQISSTAEIYDPGSAHIQSLISLIDIRMRDTSTALPDGSVLVVGGIDNSGNSIPTVERVYPGVGTSVPVGTLPFGLFGQTSTLLQDGTVLVVGGYSSQSTVVGDAGLYFSHATAAGTPSQSLQVPTDSPKAGESPAATESPAAGGSPGGSQSPASSGSLTGSRSTAAGRSRGSESPRAGQASPS